MKNFSTKKNLLKNCTTKKGIVIVIIFTMWFTSCSPQSSTPSSNISNTAITDTYEKQPYFYSAEEETGKESEEQTEQTKNIPKEEAEQEQTEKTQQKSSRKQSKAQKTQQNTQSKSKTRTKLTRATDAPKQDGSTLCYGALRITLPDGMTIEEQPAEQNMHVLDLAGAEKTFPPRLWIAHYRGAYQDDRDLASALLDILPDIVLELRHKDAAHRRYLFTYDAFYKNGYVIISGNDIYIAEEHSDERYFGNLLDENAVRLGDATGRIGDRYSEAYNAVYEKVKVEKSLSLLAVQSVENDTLQKVFLYRDGYFTSPESTFSFPETSYQIEFEDCNFDGCPDMIVPSPIDIYLWNSDKKAYEATTIPEEFPQSFWHTNCYAQTKTIYGYQYNDDECQEPYLRTETLWQWEGTALKQKRECMAAVRDEEIRIRAYESADNGKKLLFDETVLRPDWERNSDSVQACYQKFYAGLIPETNDDWLHPVTYSQYRKEYIPQALLDELANAMHDNTVSDFLGKYMIDKELTSEERIAVSKNHLELRRNLLQEWGTDYRMVWADVDNDGILDIIAKKYYNNTKSFTDYEIYQGQKDGTYKKTDSYSSVAEKFCVLNYEGKNYLCRMPYGYSINHYAMNSSMSLAYYVDGTEAETVRLLFFPQEYHIKLAECAQEHYKALAQDMLENSLDYKKRIDAYKGIDGSIEQKIVSEEYDYECDLDNDGVPEQYSKSIWMDSSDVGKLERFQIYGRDAGVKNVRNAETMAEGLVIRLWAEPFAGKTIIHIFSRTETDGFELAGFLLNGAKCQRIYRITADVTYGVLQERENIVRKNT